MYFLGFVTRENMNKGIIEPSYIVCKNKYFSQDKKYLDVYTRKTDEIDAKDTIILFGSLYGNKTIIDYMSYHQFYDGDNKSRTFLEGGLYFFECDKHGRRTGSSLFIRKVPIEADYTKGLDILRRNRYREKPLSEILSDNPATADLQESAVELHFVQPEKYYKKRKKTKEPQYDGFISRKERDHTAPDSEY